MRPIYIFVALCGLAWGANAIYYSGKGELNIRVGKNSKLRFPTENGSLDGQFSYHLPSGSYRLELQERYSVKVGKTSENRIRELGEVEFTTSLHSENGTLLIPKRTNHLVLLKKMNSGAWDVILDGSVRALSEYQPRE
jgi:hypothetical protein